MKYKRILTLTTLLMITVTSLMAQPAQRTTAWNYLREKQYERAKEAIDAASAHELTINDPKTWNFRAMIYHDIAASNDPEVRKLSEDAMTESLEAIKKCTELDGKKRYVESNNMILVNLSLLFFNLGVENYNNGIQAMQDENEKYKLYFKESLKRFEQYMNGFQIMGRDSMRVINELSRNKIDPRNVYLYAATSANQIGQLERAKSLLEGLIKSRYNTSIAYTMLADIYMSENNTDMALQTLEASKRFVTDKNEAKNITLKELMIYQQSGRISELKDKLEKAIQEDPNNPNLMLTLGETNYNIFTQLEEEITAKYPEMKVRRAMSREDVIKNFGEAEKTSKTGSGRYMKETFDYSFGQIILENNRVIDWKIKPELQNALKQDKDEAKEFLDKTLDIFINSTGLIKEDDMELQFLVQQKIGTIYYNIAVETYNQWAEERDQKKADELKKVYTEEFNKSLPYLEKAREINPSDKMVVPLLRKIYLLQNEEEKLENLKD